jgi:type I restriction enzyme, S subunit
VNDYLFQGKHLLIGEDGANLLARPSAIAFIADGEYRVNDHAHVLAEGDAVTRQYLMYLINIRPFIDWVTRSAQPELNQDNMNRIPIQVHYVF